MVETYIKGWHCQSVWEHNYEEEVSHRHDRPALSQTGNGGQHLHQRWHDRRLGHVWTGLYFQFEINESCQIICVISDPIGASVSNENSQILLPQIYPSR